MKSSDMMGGGGFKEGNIEILKSRAAVFQYPGRDGGEPGEAFPAIVWDYKVLGEDWSAPEEEHIEQMVHRVGSLDTIRPGQIDQKEVDNPDAEVEDLGTEPGVEGNTIFADQGGRLSFGWPAMVESLKKAGFKAEIIERTYMPDYTGMKAHFQSVPTGRKYVPKNSKDGKEVEAKQIVCTQIQTFPYEKKQAAKGGKTTTPKTQPKVNGSAGASTPATAAETDPMAVAKQVLTAPSDQFKKMMPEGVAKKRGVFQSLMASELVRQKVQPPALHKAVTDLLKDDDKLVELSGETGNFIVDLEANEVTFSY